jgi:endonuclease IV
LKKDEVESFRGNLKNSDVNPVFIHTSYLINLASPSDELYFKSIKAFVEEMKRADLLLPDPLGSRKDRHMHIGKGYIGLEGFRVLVNQKYLRELPFILETPKHDEKDDINNINLVKSLISN